MNMKYLIKALVAHVLMLSALAVSAQEKKIEKIPGVPPAKSELVFDYDTVLPEGIEVKGAPQGFAISGKYGFSLRNRGQCLVFDLKKNKLVNSFKLEGNTSHCNSAGFGKVKYSKDSKFPLLYVCECTGQRSCYVTDITTEGSKIVQRLFYDSDEFKIAMDWIVDAENGFIYVYGGRHFGPKYLKKLPLPKLSDSDENGEVHFTKDDVLQTIEIEGLMISQGSVIKGGKAYLPDGCSPYGNKLHIIDLATGKKVSVVDFQDQVNEPEGLAFKGKWLYVVFHNVTETIRHTLMYRMKI